MLGSLKASLLGAALGAVALQSAAASPAVPGTFTANVALTTDYMFRGVSQTSGGPAIQGGFGYENGPFYADVWGTSVDFGDAGDTNTTMELRGTIGFTPTVGPLKMDIGATYYSYPDSPQSPRQDYYEFFIGGSHSFGPLSVGAKVYYSPDFYMQSGKEWYVSLPVSLDVGDGFAVGGAYGISNFQNDTLGIDYKDWNVGISKEIEGFKLDLRYGDTINLPVDTSETWFTVSKKM